MLDDISPHLKRWISAVIAIPALFVIIIYSSDDIFSLIILAIILTGIYEYNEMVFGQDFLWEKCEGIIIAVMILAAFYISNPYLILAVLVFSLSIIFILYLIRIKDQTFDINPVSKVVLGFMYIPLTMSHFILIRRFDNGILWVFFVLVLAFSGDTVAFYVGRKWGKRKLLPLISPGKSVEGTLGLIAGSVGGCLLFQQLFFPELTAIHAVALGFVGSILGQLGDLCESVIKRASGVKDSGVIFPGHGGILDRLDCLLFITPYVYFYILFIIK